MNTQTAQADSPAKAPRDVRYLNKRQRDEIRSDISGAEHLLTQGKEQPHLRARYPRVLRKQIQNLENMLEHQGPPRLTGSDLDVAVRRRDELQEKISGALLSSEEMRKNPAGAVGKYQQSEASPRVKADILEWKNLQEIILRDSTDPDKANTDMLRRHRTPNDLGMDGAQIEGTHFSIPSPEFMRNYEQTFRGGPDPRDQEIEDLRTQLEDVISRGKAMLADHDQVVPEPKKNGGWSPEKRAKASERSRKQHAERRAAEAAAADTPDPPEPSIGDEIATQLANGDPVEEE